jgi:hypothetical protein
MVDRQQRYVSYLLSHAHRAAVDSGDPALASAAALGVQDGRGDRALRTIAEVEAEVRRLEGAPGADVAAITRELEQARKAVEQARHMEDVAAKADREARAVLDADPNETTAAAARRLVAMVPDMGPSARDERELQMARERLQKIIVADGATETGDRWLYDAAADEIVRLRAELSGARHAAQFPAHDETRRVLGAGREEATADAARRVVAELQQARAQGAAEMRERAAAYVAAHAPEDEGLREIAGRILDLPLDGAPARRRDAMARQGAAGERAAAALDGQQAGLSAEDAETLRGAGWTLRLEVWYSPAISEDYDPEIPCDLEALRSYAARYRAEKAPAAAHMGPPGKATGGEESAAAGKRSVAEKPRGAQGAPDVAHVVALLRRAEWPRTAESLERGEVTPRQTLEYLRACSSMRSPGADDRAVLDALESLVSAQAAPVALPKPKRVEVGQRWRFEVPIVDAVDLTIEGVLRGDHEALVSVRSDSGRAWFDLREEWLLNGGAWTFLGPAPTPQGPDGGSEKSEAHEPEAIAATEGLSEPTARDAVAGMLLRLGYPSSADAVARERITTEHVISKLSAAPVPDYDRACIAALERDVARSAAAALQAELERVKGETPTVGLDGDAVEEIFDATRGVRLAVPKGADARAVLATVAELLGFPKPAEEAQGQIEAIAYNHGFREGQRRARASQLEEAPVTAPDREALGRAVHKAAESSIFMKAGWDNLSHASREWRCAVGERLFAMGARHGRGEVKALVQRWRDRALMLASSSLDGAAPAEALGRAEGLSEAATDLEAALSGRPGPDGGERATGERTSSPARQEPAPHAPDGGQPVDSAARTDAQRVASSTAPVTPPAERYAAPGQDGGDVPAPVDRMVIGPHTIPGVPCASCGKATSTGCCFACTVAGRCGKAGPESAKSTQSAPCSKCRAPTYLGFCGHCDREPEPAKPASVLPRQRWRCVGLEALGELEVSTERGHAAGDAILYPVGSRDRISARAADMLALPHWSFVSGPRE